MKLLLDEMWSPEIARQLRGRNHDVEAVAERHDLRSLTDFALIAVARSEQRVIVTENVTDFRRIARALIVVGEKHAGLIFTTNSRFPRHDARTLGRLVSALDAVLRADPPTEGAELWLS